jgi:hypothetical protein
MSLIPEGWFLREEASPGHLTNGWLLLHSLFDRALIR